MRIRRRRRRKASARDLTVGVFVLVVLVAMVKAAHFFATPQGHEFFAGIVVLAAVIGLLVWHSAYTRQRDRDARIRALQIADVDHMPGVVFERYVATLMASRGFKTTLTKASGDLGVDVIAEKGGLRYAVQCKCYAKPVSRRAVSDAVAGMRIYHCNAAMVVTNSEFTEGAKVLAESDDCRLIDRPLLAQWIVEWQG